MSAISLTLLLAAGCGLAVCVAVLRAARGVRDEVAALRAELFATTPDGAGRWTTARTVPDDELIRAAVADALADERERELAEARAYWAENAARDAADLAGSRPFVSREPDAMDPLGDGALGDAAFHDHARFVPPGYEEALLDALLDRYLSDDAPDAPDAPEGGGSAFVPRQGAGGARDQRPSQDEEDERAAELAAARRRHPSHPGYTLSGEPVHRTSGERESAECEATERGTAPDREHPAAPSTDAPAASTASRRAEGPAEEHRRTTERLSLLAESGTPLADVRPGPLGTLDVFLFADGTTLCLSPGHRETAQRLASAVRSGEPPVLLGGSGVSGAYALTFGCGEESVYLLADRIVAA